MALWHNLVDVSTLNVYTIFKPQHPGDLGGQNDARRRFIKELSKELVMPLIPKRAEGCPKLQRHVLEAMARCGVMPASIQSQEENTRQGRRKRKRCKLCPTATDRKTRCCREKCNRPVCSERSAKNM
ncbi:hypothetical protein AAFF_G00238320 [Aldrovandia affinis]|uniref:PiggyBac transposable element-derived protein domain-containing protein n=1 Tax=Aldrovandia affinis TaxID=143900 RepID=A0AAD7W3R4_9TELE|nr:hypothetical protein AAFF_G00238320 [Aldrovandia affinis]